MNTVSGTECRWRHRFHCVFHCLVGLTNWINCLQYILSLFLPINWEVFLVCVVPSYLFYQQFLVRKKRQQLTDSTGQHAQALHTYRINLSPFTKDFRVWGATIETLTIYLTANLVSFLGENVNGIASPYVYRDPY